MSEAAAEVLRQKEKIAAAVKDAEETRARIVAEQEERAKMGKLKMLMNSFKGAKQSMFNMAFAFFLMMLAGRMTKDNVSVYSDK